MADLTPNHPADKVAARALCVSDEAEIAASEAYAQGVGERPFSQRMRAALSAALPHMTADDLRSTPAGQALIREGIAAARNLEWMQPRVTPGGRVYNPAIPGDDLRAFREEALAREAMQNMRESEQGRELMAEAWEEGALHQARGSAETRRVLASALPNPYRKDDA